MAHRDRAIAPDALQLEGWRVFVGNCAEKLPASNTTGLPLLVPPPGRQEQQDTGEFLDQLVDALSTEKNKDGSVIMARASSSYSPTRVSRFLFLWTRNSLSVPPVQTCGRGGEGECLIRDPTR